jgi:glucokinase
MKALAVDFGGSHASCGLVDNRRLIAFEEIDLTGATKLVTTLPEVAECFRRLLAANGAMAADCAGIAMGLPSIVDARTSEILGSRAKYEDSIGFDLGAWAREQFGLQLRAENDARMALLGESYAGAAASCENAILMTLGTGVGGAAIIERKLLRGKHAQAACLGGHFPVKFDGRLCTCGAIGCAEAEASSWALPLIAKDWPGIETSALAATVRAGATLNFRELFAAADAVDSVATAIRDRCLKVWSVAAIAMVHAYDPEILVMGGGVLARADIIVPYVQKYLDAHAWTEWGKVQVRAAALGNNAALLGAVPLLQEKFS